MDVWEFEASLVYQSYIQDRLQSTEKLCLNKAKNKKGWPVEILWDFFFKVGSLIDLEGPSPLYTVPFLVSRWSWAVLHSPSCFQSQDNTEGRSKADTRQALYQELHLQP